jgi:hypothetical protein
MLLVLPTPSSSLEELSGTTYGQEGLHQHIAILYRAETGSYFTTNKWNSRSHPSIFLKGVLLDYPVYLSWQKGKSIRYSFQLSRTRLEIAKKMFVWSLKETTCS